MTLIEATFRVEQAHFWFRGLRRFSRPLVAAAVEGIARPRILDAGCGTGANLRELSAAGDVIGFDVAAEGVRLAQQSGQRRLARARATALPFASGTFDLVTAFDLFACLTETEQAATLLELRRVLRPGGALLVNTAALNVLRGHHSLFGGELRRLTRPRLRSAMEAAGFEVERLTYTNFTLLPLIFVVRLGQRLMGLPSPEERSADLGIPWAPINGALTSLLAVEARFLRSMDMPLGSSILGLARRRY